MVQKLSSDHGVQSAENRGVGGDRRSVYSPATGVICTWETHVLYIDSGIESGVARDEFRQLVHEVTQS